MNDHDELLSPEARQALDDAFAGDQVGPIPDHLQRFARSAYGWRAIDAELATVAFDSAVDRPVGVRGGGSERRRYRYEVGGTTINVSLTDASITVMIDGHGVVPVRIVSAASDEQTVRHVTTDDYGELTDAAPDLPARVEADLPTGSVVTPWITG